MPQQRPGLGRPFRPGTYRKGSFRVTLGKKGEIQVAPGDWISKYSACLYGDPLMGWDEFGREENGAIRPLPDPNQIRAGETLYHLPTYRASTAAPPPPAPFLAPSTGIWFGLGVNYGGHFFAIGTNAAHAWVFSLDDYHDNFLFTSEGWRLGPGLGGGYGVALVVITSLRNPSMFETHVSSGWGVELSLGSKWKEVAEHAKHYRVVQRIVETMEKSKGLRKASQSPLVKRALKMGPGDWDTLRKRISELVSVGGLKTDAALPQMATVGIPVPYSSLELSGYWEFRNYRVELVNRGGAATQ